MDFSQGAGQTTSADIMDKDTLAWAVLTVRGLNTGGSGSKYLDCELTITDDHPRYARRKVYEKIGDPHYQGNSENYRQMSMVAISRILEAGRGASPNNPGGYSLQAYEQLSALRVAIRIGIEAARDGYDAKNRVAEFLTPNPDSKSGHSLFKRLMEGKYTATDAPQQGAQPGFGFSGQAPAGAGPQPSSNWGSGNQQQPGFQQPQQQQQPQQENNASGAGWGSGGSTTSTNGGPQPNASQEQQPAHTTSHSDPQQPPNWMAQANQ